MKISKLQLLGVLALVSLHQTARATIFLWGDASGDMTWSNTLNWTPSGSPGSADTAVFGTADTTGAAATVNNTVTVNTTITALTFTNSTSGAWNVTDIPTNVILTVSGATTVGGLSVATGAPVTDAAVTDAGTLVMDGSLTIGNNDSGSTAGSSGTLNLSGLNNFIYNDSGGTITISTGARSSGNLLLAAVSNSITVGTINDNTAQSSSTATGNITLGAGTNIINVGTFNIGAARGSSTVSFPGTGGLRLRGVGGTDTNLATMTLGNRNNSGGSGNSCTGTLSFNGFPVDMRLATLTMGESASNPSGTAPGNGTIMFDTGTIFASNIIMAVTTGTTVGVQANGTIDIGANATLTIGPGGMNMVNQAAASGPATGALNITGGTVITTNNITKTSTLGTASITMNGGVFSMTAGSLGTSAVPIDNLNLTSATLTLAAGDTAANAFVTSLNVNDNGTIINISSLPGGSGVGSTLPVISYASYPTSGILNLGTLPGGFQGYLTNANSVISLVLTNATSKSDLWTGNADNIWNTTSVDWTSSGNPTTYNESDAVVFDDTAKTTSVTLSVAHMPASWTVNNSISNYTFSGTGGIGGGSSLIKNDAATLTLSESGGDNFTGGIGANGGTLVLDDANSSISGGLNIANGATVQIGNNDANGALPSGALENDGALVFDQTSSPVISTAILGGGSLTQEGSSTLTLSAVNTYSGNTTVNGGTLALGSTGSIANSAQVTVTGAALDVSAAGSASLNSLSLANATLDLSVGYIQTNLNVSGLTLGGTTNVVNISSLPPIASYPTSLPLVHSSSSISGTDIGLGSLPAASPSYAGSISISADQSTVLLDVTSGPVGTRPDVVWTGADVPSETSTNWSDGNNWALPGPPVATDYVVFTDAGAASGSPFSSVGGGVGGIVSSNNIDSIIDRTFTIDALEISNVVSDFQNIMLASGVTLNIVSTNTNDSPRLFTVGSASTDFGGSANGVATLLGAGGTLNLSNTNGQIFVGYGGSATSEQATLDLSGLGLFQASVSTLFAGVGSSAGAIGLARESGVVYLALTNIIHASAALSGTESSDTSATGISIDVGEDDGNGGKACAMYLGQSNAIFADAIGAGRQKTSGTIEFNPSFANNSIIPTAYLRGFSASAMSVLSIGDGVVNSGTATCTGICDFTSASGGSDGYVDALIATIYVGRAASNSTGSGTATGTLSLDDGIIEAATVFAGYQPTNNTKNGIGTITVNSNSALSASGALSITGVLNLGITLGGAGAATTSGTLNVGGTAAINSIVCGTNGASSTINLNSGTLIVGNTAGTPSAPLTTLGLTGGVLELNVSGLVPTTNIVATSVTTSGTTSLVIGSVEGVTVGQTNALISYTGADPYSSLALSLPAGYVGSLVDDTTDSLISLVLTTIPPTPRPVITRVALQSGSVVAISGTNGTASGNYLVLTTTNLALPLSEWTRLATNVFVNGDFSFTVPAVTNPPAQFFNVEIP